MKKETIDINEATVKKYMESVRPENPEIRSQLDYGYSFDGMAFVLFEIRPEWDNPEKSMNRSFAKIRFYKSRQTYNLYWMRANGKWELYEPFTESRQLDKILDVIEKDEYGCFYG